MKIRKIICWILLIIIAIIAIINVTLLVKNKIFKEKIPYVCGYVPFIMQTDDMKPVINIYDLIIDKEIKSEEDINTGDIISFQYGDKIITQKISKIVIQDGRKNYLMKSENSDNTIVTTFPNMTGKYVFKILYLGQVIEYTRTPFGLVLSIIIIVIPFIIVDLIIKRMRINKLNKMKEELNQSIKEKQKLEEDENRRKQED